MKLKIISDGTPYGTQVVDSETGKIVEKVISVDWHIGIDQIATAVIGLCMVDVDVVAEKSTLPWYAMKDAPKDGTFILAKTESGHPAIVQWCSSGYFRSNLDTPPHHDLVKWTWIPS